MNKSLTLILLITFSSCSTLKKTIIYSSLAGATVGATSGVLLSPNKESRGANAVVFGLVGAGVAGLLGYALYKDDPRNYKLNSMLLDKENNEIITDPNLLQIDLEGLNINANLNKNEIYEVPLKDLPKELEGKVNKQFLIKYKSKERYIKKGNKTFYIPSFNLYEHSYGETPNGH